MGGRWRSGAGNKKDPIRMDQLAENNELSVIEKYRIG